MCENGSSDSLSGWLVRVPRSVALTDRDLTGVAEPAASFFAAFVPAFDCRLGQSPSSKWPHGQFFGVMEL